MAALTRPSNQANLGSMLVYAIDAKQRATDILESAYSGAAAWVRQFYMDEVREILAGMARQRTEVANFFTAVHRGITTGCAAQSTEALEETFTSGAWGGFFDCMRSGRHNVELTKSTQKRGKKRRAEREAVSTDKSGSSSSDSEDSEWLSRRKRRREKGKKRKQAHSTTDGSGKANCQSKGRSSDSSDGSARSSGVKCKF